MTNTESSTSRDVNRVLLSELPIGTAGRIAEIRGGRSLTRRLLGLGLRPGSRVEVLHQRGRGVVVTNGEARVALGGGIVDKVIVEALDERAGTAS